MRHQFLLFGTLGMLCLAALSCNPKIESDDPFAGAKWIGTSERVLYSDFLPQFVLSADIDIADGSTRASVLLGGNDPRLMDADLNIMGVENGPDESFVRVELDREKKCVNVYRTGYTKEDVPGKVLQSLPVADSLLTDGPAKLTVQVTYNQLQVSLGGVSLGRGVTVGPLGRSGDFIAYPQLADVGWQVEEGQTARVYNLEVREIRGPHALLYRNEGMADAASGVKDLCEPSCGGMPVLRNSFKLKKKEIESATLYATARGIYEISLNGEIVGADFLAPGLSQYNKHHYYQCYDVTKQLMKGKNEFLVSLAEGWWSGDVTFGSANRNYFGDQLAFLASLHVKYADGSTQTVVTDPSWRVTTDGPVVYASLFHGQVTDGQRSLANASWRPAEEMVLEGHVSDATFGQTAPRTDEYDNWELVPQEDPSPRVFTTLTAESVDEVRPGVFVYDMGQNFAGVPSITLRGLKEGQQLRFRYAEVLYPDLPEYEGNEGMLMLENIRGAMAQDIYVASNEPVQNFEPHLTQHGYRYLEITGVDQAPAVEDVKGLVISSVQSFTAHYESSNPLVNRLWDNIRWSMLGNFISIPTDCPQRNERMGWSGDLSVFSRTATYLSDVDAFLTRHTQAIRDVQMPNGRMPDVAPIGGAFGGLLWGSAGVTVPYECYRQYGDTAILALNYDAMDSYMNYVEQEYVEKETGLLTQGNRGFGGLGDWLGPQNGQLDNSAIWDAYYVFDLGIMQEVATVLGRDDDAAKYELKLAQRKKQFVDRYFDRATGRFVASGYRPTRPGQTIHIQSSYVLPLAFGIIEDEALRRKVVNNLVETILRPGATDSGIVCPPYSLMTGFITTAWISKALSDNGRSDMAYRLLQQTSWPSWLYPVTQGATTIWERLDSYTKERGFGGNNSMNSFNHYSFGAVGQWLMSRSLGIDRDPATPGFKHFVLRPEADPTGQMTWAKGWYDTPYGRIGSSWKRTGGKVEYEFTIPEGCSATLRIPGMPEQELSAGHYTF